MEKYKPKFGKLRNSLLALLLHRFLTYGDKPNYSKRLSIYLWSGLSGFVHPLLAVAFLLLMSAAVVFVVVSVFLYLAVLGITAVIVSALSFIGIVLSPLLAVYDFGLSKYLESIAIEEMRISDENEKQDSEKEEGD